MMLRLAVFNSALAGLAALLLGPSEAFPQTPQPGSNSTSQQPAQPRPKVFFPMAEQPEMEMHHHGQIPEVMPQFPRLGDSQRVVSGPIYQLSDLEEMAARNNPTLSQAQRAVEAAQARKLQVGLYPNPVVGYQGDEIRGGSYGGGEQGFFVEQPVILGGKLGLNRKIAAAEEVERQVKVEAQRQRIENDVRMAYYRVLTKQERLALKRDILAIAQSIVRIEDQLGQVGQADETLATSPAVRAAQASVERAEAALRRAKREPIPDLILRGGLQQNFEPLATPTNRRVGLQGFAEIGVQLHLWDRNQGSIAAERANVEAARGEVRRVELALRNRFAMYGEDYSSARLTSDKYRTEILPRLERAYKLMTEQYGLMTASFMRVLLLQRMLYENETAYIDALERTWTSSIALRGFLLEGALVTSYSKEIETPMSDIENTQSIGESIRTFGWRPSSIH